MPSSNVVTWIAMILGHVKCGQGQRALELFRETQQEGVWPDSVILVGVLNACASMVALEEARCVHQQIIGCGWDSDVFVANSLVDMYTKCESIEDACRAFNKMLSQDVVTWNAIILGHVKCGQGQKALELFQQMQQEACSHAGLVDEGMHCYASMVTVYMISAKLEDYTCMVDLLGRAGHLQEAENMVMAMPCKPQVAAWMALLSACRIHGNVEMAEHVTRRILEMEPDNAASYVLLATGIFVRMLNVKEKKKV
ncbi:unnamed protein product [Sphagnum troendelagicum]|uniref:Pentatricopeptide repeat-containing protein n=1 Tax=Sphagnum troendelagicum TaxID=128251 RepID=A0ABP0TTZ4_9BRYO